MPALKKNFTLPNGEEVEMFYIGTLAYALGRKPITIRKWEVSGIIPDPTFRDKSGNRLYTQEQIDTIVALAEKYKITQGRAIHRTPFSIRCREALDKLNKKYREVKK